MKRCISGFILILCLGYLTNAQNPFGNGSDNDLNVASGSTYLVDQVKSAVTGNNPAGNMTIMVASSAGFTIGNEVMVITMQDAEPVFAINKSGNYEFNQVTAITGNKLTLATPLKFSYLADDNTRHQVIRVPNFQNVTVNGTLTCSNWDGTTGGVLCFRALAVVSGSGNITATGKGYRGGKANIVGTTHTNGFSGESYTKNTTVKASNYKDINKGGGASGDSHNINGSNSDGTGGGGGGSFGTAGTNGATNTSNAMGGWAGEIYGTPTLDKILLGSGGGGTGTDDYSDYVGAVGGNGGGVIMIFCSEYNNIGITCNGANGLTPTGTTYSQRGGSGGGSGGSVLIHARSINLQSAAIAASGGTGGAGISFGGIGGNGGNGRIRVNSNTSNITGTILPQPFTSNSYIAHLPYNNTENWSTAYEITAYIYDLTDITASVNYSINGGAYTSVSMTDLTNNLYKAQIPAQSANTTINYYISVSSGGTTYNLPDQAPSKVYTFKIIGIAPDAPLLSCNEQGIVTVSWTALSSANLVDYSVYRSTSPNFNPGAANIVVPNTTETTYSNTGLEDGRIYYYKVSANYNLGVIPSKSFSAETSIKVNNINLTTVSGNAYLESEGNHAGIKVLFKPVSESAVKDSTYTDALGYYSLAVASGSYQISYIKPFFATYTTGPISYIVDINRGITNVYSVEDGAVIGSVKGIWSGKYYGLTGNVTINSGDTLTIKKGAIIRSYGNYNFTVNGYLRVEGALNDSVTFTRGYPDMTPNWGGIDINDSANDKSFLHYTNVEYGVEGLWVINATPEVMNSKFRFNTATGIYCEDNASLKIKDVEIYRNVSYGMYIRDGAAPTLNNLFVHHNVGKGIQTYSCGIFTLANSKISNNESGVVLEQYSRPVIRNTEFIYNSLKGIHIGWYSSVDADSCKMNNNEEGLYFYYGNAYNSYIKNSSIQNNSSNGIRIDYNQNVFLENVRITNNGGHGLQTEDSGTTMLNKTLIANNAKDGILRNGANNLSLTFCTIYGNKSDGVELNGSGTDNMNSNIIVNNTLFGLKLNNTLEGAANNNVYGNGSGLASDLSKLPVDAFTFIQTNGNGDPADIHLNTSYEPSFTDPANNNFILKAISKCINAGSRSVIDPDGTISDQGAIYRDLGNPHKVNVVSYAENSIAINWKPVALDSLTQYKVYYKLASDEAYTYFNQTTTTNITVTGLENNKTYDFTVTGVFPRYESGYAPKATGIPGLPQIAFDPTSMNLTCPSTVPNITQVLKVSNSGSRELNFSFADYYTKGYATFDGNGDYVNVGNPANYNELSAFTMETWIRRRNNGHFEFMGKHYKQYSFYCESSANKLGVYKGTGSDHISYPSRYVLPANEWVHVAVTWKGSVLTFYANGKQVDLISNVNQDVIPARNYNFQLGRRADENSYYLNGDMAEAKLWNYARTEGEIFSGMYNSLKGNEYGLLGYWPMHTDFNDNSNNKLVCTKYGNATILVNEAPTFMNNALIISNINNVVQPGETKDITFTFPRLTDATATGSILFKIPVTTDIQTQPKSIYDIFVAYGDLIPSTPLHYISVAPTDFKYDIVITNAFVDGVAIQPGDEIGIFDGSLCVGSGIYTSFNFVIPVHRASVSLDLPGYTLGNNMSFKIYRKAVEMEASCTATYSVGDGKFGYRKFTSLALTGTIFKIQRVPVAENSFSLISFNMNPRVAQSAQIFSNLTGMEIVYDDKGRAIIPRYTVNTIGDIDFRKGYHVYSTKKDTINFSGTIVNPSNYEINVEANKWNSIAYLGYNEIDVTTAFPETFKNLIAIVQASDGGAWIPDLAQNTLGMLKPGLGYQLALKTGSSNTSFTYQATALKAATINLSISQNTSKYFSFNTTGLPFIVVIHLPESGFPINYNDEIGLFDGNICVGAAVYSGNRDLMITAWEGSAAYNLNGFSAGNPIRAKLFNVSTQNLKELNLSGVSSSSDLLYKSGHYANLKVTNSSTKTGEFQQLNITRVFPNPCTNFIDISYFSPNITTNKLILTDLLGRIVFEQNDLVKLIGNHHLQLDTRLLKSGTYILQLINESGQIAHYKVIKQ